MNTFLYVVFLLAVFYIPFALLQMVRAFAKLLVALKQGGGTISLLPFQAWWLLPSVVVYIVWYVGA